MSDDDTGSGTATDSDADSDDGSGSGSDNESGASSGDGASAAAAAATASALARSLARLFSTGEGLRVTLGAVRDKMVDDRVQHSSTPGMGSRGDARALA